VNRKTIILIFILNSIGQADGILIPLLRKAGAVMRHYKLTMLKLLTTYFLTLLVTVTFAQKSDTLKISGKIISAKSGEGIPDATIMITRTKGFKCDSLGNFTIYNLSKGQHKLSFSAFGYDNKDTLVSISNKDIINFTWTIYTECWIYNREKALLDIKAKRPTILLQGGIAPVVYTSDRTFENRYKISFNDFGCVASDSLECLIAYNKTIFDYLDNTYGKKWRKEIRKDAIGLRDK